MSRFEWAATAEEVLNLSRPAETTLGQEIAQDHAEAAEVLFRDNDIISSDPLDGISQSGVYPVRNSDKPHLLYAFAAGVITEKEYNQELREAAVVKGAGKVVAFAMRAA